MGGGGGQSGVVTFPNHVTNWHQAYLGFDYDPDAEGRNFTALQHASIDNRSLHRRLVMTTGPLTDETNPYRQTYSYALNDGHAETLSDITTQQGEQSTRLNEYDARILAIDEEATIASILQRAAQEVDIAGRLNNIALSTLEADAVTLADTEFTAAQAKKGTAIIEQSLYQSYMDSAISKVDQSGTMSTIDFAAIVDAAEGQSPAVVAAALTAAMGNTTISPVTDWTAHIDAVVPKLKECGVISKVDIPQLFNESMAEATSQIERSIESANEIIDSQLIQDVVNSYEQAISYRRGSTRSTYAARMADVNAVNGSAFLIGMALIDAQFQADVNDFDKKIRLQVYSEAQAQHGQRVQQFFSLAVQAAGIEIQNRTQVFIESLKDMVQLLATRASFEQSLTDLFGAVFGAQIGPNASTETSDARSRDDLIKAGLASLTAMMEVKNRYEQTLMQLHSQLFSDSLQKKLATASLEKTHRDRSMLALTGEMSKIFMDRHHMDASASSSYVDLRRTQIIQSHELEGTNLDIRAKSGLWPIKVHQEAVNVLAGPAGMAATLPPGPSALGSAVGGILGGAGQGAALGPPGMAAGAILGGLASIF